MRLSTKVKLIRRHVDSCIRMERQSVPHNVERALAATRPGGKDMPGRVRGCWREGLQALTAPCSFQAHSVPPATAGQTTVLEFFMVLGNRQQQCSGAIASLVLGCVWGGGGFPGSAQGTM